eukprot:Sspe_Gene.65572::Locus_38805_Transcript_3_4_Confidence_0.250_Length_2185::g.65572::m.65572
MEPLGQRGVNQPLAKRKAKKGLPGNARRLPVTSDVRCMEVVGHDVWTGDRDGCIVIRRARTGEIVHTIKPTCKGITVWCLRFIKSSHAAPSVWAGLSNGVITVYDPEDRKQKRSLAKHTGGVYMVVEGVGRAFSCSNDFEIYEWTTNTYEFLRRYSGHKGYVRCLLSCGPALLSGSDDATIKIWDVATGSSTHTVRHHTKGVHAMVKVSQHVWSAGGAEIVVWDYHSLGEVVRLSQHAGPVLTLQRVGSRVYSGGADHEICAWDAHSRQLLGRFTDHTGWVYALCNTAKVVRYYMWSTSISDGCIQIWQHDEYHTMDSYTREQDARSTDAVEETPEWKLAEHLQDTCYTMDMKCRSLTDEIDSTRRRMVLLEEELRKQHNTLAHQLGMQRTLTTALADVNNAKVPGLEHAVKEKETELKRYVDEIKEKTDAITKLQAEGNKKDVRIKELERKLAAAEGERDTLKKSYEEHQKAHMKYIECDVEGTLRKAREQEEGLRAEAERLRKQLAEAIEHRVRSTAADSHGAAEHSANYLDHEAKRALSAGPPSRHFEGTGLHPSAVEWCDPSLGDYIHRRYYSRGGPAPPRKGRPTRPPARTDPVTPPPAPLFSPPRPTQGAPRPPRGGQRHGYLPR